MNEQRYNSSNRIIQAAAMLYTSGGKRTRYEGARSMSDSTIPKKVCSICGRKFPATPEYFHRAKSGKYGVRAYCKDCANEIERKRHHENRDEILPKKRAYVQSHKEQEYRRRDAWYEQNREAVLARKRHRWAENSETVNAVRRQKYHENSEKYLEEKRRYRETRREYLRAKAKEYYSEHTEDRKAYAKLYRRQHADIKRLRDAEWRRKNPERVREKARESEARRRARLLGLPHDWSHRDWEYCLSYWGHCCCVCGRQAGGQYVLAREHWIPISDPRPDNPGTVPWNILPMCHTKHNAATGESGCNNSKWSKDPVVWLVERLGEYEAAQKLAEIEAYFERVKAQHREVKHGT